MPPLAQSTSAPISRAPLPPRRRPRTADEVERQRLRRRLLVYILQTHHQRMALRGLGNPALGQTA